MTTSLASRIRKARKDAELTQEAVAKHFGIKRVSVTQWELGATRPATERIEELAKLLNVSADWLLGGNSGSLQSSRNESLTPEIPISGGVRVTGYVEAGRYFDIDDDPTIPGELFAPTLGGYDLKDQRAYMVAGNSINRVAKPGDILVCVDHVAVGANVHPGDLVIVERSRYGGQMIERTAKRLRRGTKGEWELWPDSNDPAFQSPTVLTEAAEHEEIRIAAKVLWIVSKP